MDRINSYFFREKLYDLDFIISFIIYYFCSIKKCLVVRLVCDSLTEVFKQLHHRRLVKKRVEADFLS